MKWTFFWTYKDLMFKCPYSANREQLLLTLAYKEQQSRLYFSSMIRNVTSVDL